MSESDCRQMASITLSLPDDLASKIRAEVQQLPRILELGLRELNADRQSGFDGAADVLELLAAAEPLRGRTATSMLFLSVPKRACW